MNDNIVEIRHAALKPKMVVEVLPPMTRMNLGWHKISGRELSEDRESLILTLDDRITWHIRRQFWDDLAQVRKFSIK